MDFILPVRFCFTWLVLTFSLSTICLCQSKGAEEWFGEAVQAQQRGDFPAAIRDYQQVLRLDPQSVPAMANLGATLVHAGRFEEGVGEYRSALRLDPANDALRMNLALAFYKKPDYKAAAAELQEVHRRQPSDPRSTTLLGDCLLHLDRPQEAADITVPLAQANPGDLDLAFVAGSALIRSGKRREGLPYIEEVAKKGNSPDAYMLAGKTWLEVKEFESARQDLDAALKLNPDLPSIHTLAGVARDNSGDPSAAEPEFRRALELNPNDFQANLYLGAILYKRRDLDGARTYLRKALKSDPGSGLARYEMGMVESASGELAAAAADLQKASQKDPNWLEPHVELAALFFKMHRTTEGTREREIVDRLTAEQQRRGPE